MAYYYNGAFFTNRKLVTVDGTKVKTLTDIPLTLQIYLPGVKSDGGDIRLSLLDGTPIPREIEWCWSATDYVILHYKVDTVENTDLPFYVYWGNSSLSEPAADSTYGSQAVWNSGYAAVYHMNTDPSTTGLVDSTVNANNGIMNGSMTSDDLVDGNYGKAIEFDGIDDFFNIPHRMINQVCSIESFAKYVGTGDDSYIIDYSFWNGVYTGGNFYEGNIYVENGYGIHWALSSLGAYPANRNDYYLAGTADLRNTYSYLADTFAGDSIGHAYENGLSIGNDSFGYGAWGSAANYAIRVGAALNYDVISGSTMRYFNGFISEVRFSTVQRTSDYITTTYNTLKNPTNIGTAPFYKTFGPVQHGRKAHIMFM